MEDTAEIVWRIFQPPMESALAWGARTPQFVGGRLAGVEGLRGFIQRYGNGKADCYFTPNPVMGDFTTRPSARHISHVRTIIIDLDPVREADCVPEYSKIERSVIACAENLLGRRLYPDRIDSGRGLQWWIRLTPTPVSSEEEKSIWRSALGNFLSRLDQDLGIVCGLRIDTSVSDLPRLVRLPGTINTKTGRMASFIGVGSEHSEVGSILLERFGLSSPYQRPVPCGGDWRRSFHLLHGRTKRFLSEGVCEPGRHAAAYHAAASMKEVGASYDITERMVLLGARKCSPPLSDSEAVRCVRNAFKGGLIGS